MADGILLLHAFPLDSWMWNPQIDALGGELIVVAPNLPGFGGAPASQPVMGMDLAADLAADALDKRGVGRAVVCGLSMGGYVALAFWLRHRNRVTGLVLANTRAGADDEAARERRRALAARLRQEGNGFLADDPPPLLSSEAGTDLWEAVKGNIRSQSAEAIAAASLGMAERRDATADLPGITVPTMVITSTGDTLIPPAASTPMAVAIPGAQLEIIAKAGHLSNLEAAEQFNRLLHEHLTRSGVVSPRRRRHPH